MWDCYTRPMSQSTETAERTRRGLEPPDLSERGGMKNGQPQRSDERLFMQFVAFGGCADSRPLAEELERAEIPGVLYEDVNDPRGVGLLTLSQDPGFFVDRARPLLNGGPFAPLVQKPEYTMFGRTYSLGYEPDLPDTLLQRPRRTVLNPAWPWAIWYPLRRTGAFARLSREEQGKILHEHATIGRAYGDADHAHDIRLACYGLDSSDNDFVIGLVGRALHPLSHLVQAMRRTIQTSEYIEKLGPFFVGNVVWQRAR